MTPYLIRDRARMETVFEDPYILMTTKPISSVQELMGGDRRGDATGRTRW